MSEVNQERVKNDWVYQRLTQIYHDCLVEGHMVVVIIWGQMNVVMHCRDCKRVWKLTYGRRAELMSLDDDKIETEGLRSAVERDNEKANASSGVEK